MIQMVDEQEVIRVSGQISDLLGVPLLILSTVPMGPFLTRAWSAELLGLLPRAAEPVRSARKDTLPSHKCGYARAPVSSLDRSINRRTTWRRKIAVAA